MNDQRSRNRRVLPAVWHGAVTLWHEMLRGTPPEAVVASTVDEPVASWSNGLSVLELQRLLAEYEFARERIEPSGKPHEPGAAQPSSRLK
jgi:hypothetical protein